MSSTTQSLRPGRRRPAPLSLLCMIMTLLGLISFTTAYDMSFERGIYDSVHFRELEQRGEIHFDASPEPVVGLDSRQVLDESTSTSSPPAAASTSASSSLDTSVTTTATSISMPSSSTSPDPTSTTTLETAPSTTVITTPLPSPFDTSLGNNFTSTSCPTFFTNFLSNSTFRSCTPVSLMMQNSASFFRAQRSPALLSETLDTACSAPSSVCTPLMSYFANELMKDSNCGRDFRDQNPLVLQAYNGLVAYEPLYKATCIKDKQGEYCYSNAITNVTNPGDAYPYFTALGLPMLGIAHPTCNQCLKQTMEIFAEYAVNKVQALSVTYLPCAQQVNGGCGVGYANANVKVGTVDSGMGDKAQSMKSIATKGTRANSIVAMAVALGMVLITL